MKMVGIKYTQRPKKAKYVLYKKDKTGLERVLRRKMHQIEASMDKIFGNVTRAVHPYRLKYHDFDHGRKA